MKKLIRYSETPQVTGLEYSELRDLKKHPEKKEFYKSVVNQRIRMDARRKQTKGERTGTHERFGTD